MSNSDLSYIKTLEDLRAMQVMVKLRIKEREKDLGDRLRKVPQEAIKSTVGAVVPKFLENKMAGTALVILRSVLGMIFRRKNKKDGIKENIFSSAKQLSFFTLLRAGYNLWKKK